MCMGKSARQQRIIEKQKKTMDYVSSWITGAARKAERNLLNLFEELKTG